MRGLHQRLLDAARRHDRPRDCETLGVHELSRLHPRLPAPRRRADAGKPSWDIQAGYVLRALHALPKSGTKRPWNVRQNYFADAIDYRFDRIEEAMVFGRAPQPATAAS
ncbi:flavin-binding family monooxygenase domain protein [Mycobacterium xenopi 3993]|nr:flavin-binding family monooxygenase domain protein [Mycobacterium xenopi 3993]